MRNERNIMSMLMKISGTLLAVSLLAKWVGGYILRGWAKVYKSRDLSVDVIAPNYGPALVVSTEDFEDGFHQILSDSYHTQTLRRAAQLELVRKCAIVASLVTFLVTCIFWLFSSKEDER